jgi:hypothetical protein
MFLLTGDIASSKSLLLHSGLLQICGHSRMQCFSQEKGHFAPLKEAGKGV